jgi:hypothetical protein
LASNHCFDPRGRHDELIGLGHRQLLARLSLCLVDKGVELTADVRHTAALGSIERTQDVLQLRIQAVGWDWVFMVALDLEVFFGLLLYFGLSPYMREALSNLGMALRDPGLRFWPFTHAATMFVALVAVRAGRVFAMGEPTSPARRNGRYICFGIAVLAMVAGIPWPGLAHARPLFRF